jgi:hypothetical protein
MEIESLVDSMSRSEQIAALQIIWDRLSASPEGTQPPDWHGEVLAERRATLENGTAKLVDWADAQKRLRERFD